MTYSDKPKPLPSFFHRWLVTTLGVLLAEFICDDIVIKGASGLLVAPLLIVVLNAIVKPLLLLLSLPLLVLTLGLFLMVINAFLLLLTSSLMGDTFQVHTFGTAFLGALIISVVTIIGNTFARIGNSRIKFHRPGRRPPERRDDDDDGPVIDV